MRIALAYCAVTVASAAPFMPRPNVNMSRGSKIRLTMPESMTAMNGVFASLAAWKPPPSATTMPTAGTPIARSCM